MQVSGDAVGPPLYVSVIATFLPFAAGGMTNLDARQATGPTKGKRIKEVANG